MNRDHGNDTYPYVQIGPLVKSTTEGSASLPEHTYPAVLRLPFQTDKPTPRHALKWLNVSSENKHIQPLQIVIEKTLH